MSNYLMITLAFLCCLGVTSAITNVLPSTTDNDGADLVTLQIGRSQIGLLNDAQYDLNNQPLDSFQLKKFFDLGGEKAQPLDRLDSQVSFNDLHILANMEEASNSDEALGKNKPLGQKTIIPALDATPERFYNTSPNLILTTDEKVVNVNIMASSESNSFLSNVGRFIRDLYKVSPKNQNSVFNINEEQQMRRISSHNDKSDSFSGSISPVRFINPSFRRVQLEDSTEMNLMRSKYNQMDEEYSENTGKGPCPLQEVIVIKMEDNILGDQIDNKIDDETILEQQQNDAKFEKMSTDSGCLKFTGSVSDSSLKEKLLCQEFIHSEVDPIVEDDYYGVPSSKKYHETKENIPGSALKNILENVLENVPQNVLPMEPISISSDGLNFNKDDKDALQSMLPNSFEIIEISPNKAIILKNENINIDKIIEEEARKDFQNDLDFITDNGDEVENRLNDLKIHNEQTKRNIFPSISNNKIYQQEIKKSETKFSNLEKEKEKEKEILKKKDNSYLSYLSLFSSSTISNLLTSLKNYCNSYYLSRTLNQNEIISKRKDSYDEFVISPPLSLPSIDQATLPRTTSISSTSYYLRGSVPLPLSLPCIDLSHPSMTVPVSPSSPSSVLSPSSSLSALSLLTHEDSDMRRKNSRRKLQVRKKYIREDESNSDTENSLPLSALFRSYFSSSDTEPLLSVPRKIKKAIVKKIKNKAVKSRLDSTVNVKKNTAKILASKIIELNDIADKEKGKKEQLGLTDNEKLKLPHKKTLSIISDVIKNEKEKKTNLLSEIRNSDVNSLFVLNEFKEMRKKKHNDPLLMSPYFEVKKSKNRNLKNERKSVRGNSRFNLNQENSNLAGADPAISTNLIQLPKLTEEEMVANMNRNILIGNEFRTKMIRDEKIIGEVKKAEKHRLREKYEALEKSTQEVKFEKQILDEKIINTLVQADMEWEVAQKSK